MEAAWHVGFVRSIMHGRDGVTSDLLCDEARRAGADGVRTYHSTGNVIFRAQDGGRVCAHLTEVVTDLVGRDTTVIHRTAEELAVLAAADLFASAPDGVAEHLVVLSSVLLDVDELRGTLPEGLGLLGVVGGRDAAFWRGDTSGPHPHPVVEALSGSPATARSVSTIEGVNRQLSTVTSPTCC